LGASADYRGGCPVSVTFFDGVRAGTAKSIMLTAKRFAAPLQYQ
jgi:hypothetical protein